ncbi:MAG: hypothetical protein M1820_009270 [Bogoriella megaspora]|nr:MAG: hypothetical protein M1820_009270 [Bogoriella megaspora]
MALSNKSHTLPFAHRQNIARLALNPKGNLFLSVDDDGRAILTHLPRRVVLYHFSFKGNVSALTFSPSGRHFAVAIGRRIEVWQTPSTPGDGADGELEFAPFVRHHQHMGHYDTVQSIEWSSDSRFFLSASKDLTARIWSLNPEPGFIPTTLSGHRQGVYAAYFSKDQEKIYTVSRDGALFEWQYTSKSGDEDIDEDERWRIVDKHFFMQSNTNLTCAAYHAESNLLVAGFSNGTFSLYELPDFNQIHNLSISQNDIDFVSINRTGEWLAFGASRLGQLLVWEWQSESYILKQQGHFDSMNAIAYSPDGTRVVTAADDGKIKIWDANSGFCVVTFTEHTSGVTACEFAKRGNVLFTASLDGSVRAWDLIRYRNFRTFTAPTRLSFSSLAVDPSGEVVCAGSLDSFDIHTWSVQTGQLLDQLAGHEGPVSCLAFAPDGSSLMSGSWDHTVRIWSIFARTQTSEPLQLQADVLAIAVRPDSQQLSVAALDGSLTFWSIEQGSQEAGFDARRDVSGGRKLTDRRTAASSAGTKSFTSIAYAVDGSCVVASGNSNFICLYDVRYGALLRKYTVSINRALDATTPFLNSRDLTEAGPRDLIDTAGEASDLEDRLDEGLPGSKKGRRVDAAKRNTRPEIRVPAVTFSPTARSFAAASTEGLLIYSLDAQAQTSFDPLDLDVQTTPQEAMKALGKKEYLNALLMAFRLNDAGLMLLVYQSIPADPRTIVLIAGQLPEMYLGRMLGLVARTLDETQHLEFGLWWVRALLEKHGRILSERKAEFAAEMRGLSRVLRNAEKEVGRMADGNMFQVDWLLTLRSREMQKVDGDKFNGLLTPGSKHNNHDSMNIDNGNGVSDEGSWEGVDGEDDADEWIGLDA